MPPSTHLQSEWQEHHRLLDNGQEERPIAALKKVDLPPHISLLELAATSRRLLDSELMLSGGSIR